MHIIMFEVPVQHTRPSCETHYVMVTLKAVSGPWTRLCSYFRNRTILTETSIIEVQFLDICWWIFSNAWTPHPSSLRTSSWAPCTLPAPPVDTHCTAFLAHPIAHHTNPALSSNHLSFPASALAPRHWQSVTDSVVHHYRHFVAVIPIPSPFLQSSFSSLILLIPSSALAAARFILQ